MMTPDSCVIRTNFLINMFTHLLKQKKNLNKTTTYINNITLLVCVISCRLNYRKNFCVSYGCHEKDRNRGGSLININNHTFKSFQINNWYNDVRI